LEKFNNIPNISIFPSVIATPNPDVNEPNLPASWMLTGGTGTGELLRTVDRTIAAKTVLTCSCGTSSKTTTIYVAEVDRDISGVVNANKENPGGQPRWSGVETDTGETTDVTFSSADS
jgi:hypothetical protein